MTVLRELPDLVEQSNPIANQSIGIGATVNSTPTVAPAANNARVWWKTKGANTTGKLQGSFNGTDWYDLQTLAAGINPIVAVCEQQFRVQVTNAGAGAETNDVWLHLRAD